MRMSFIKMSLNSAEQKLIGLLIDRNFESLAFGLCRSRLGNRRVGRLRILVRRGQRQSDACKQSDCY